MNKITQFFFVFTFFLSVMQPTHAQIHSFETSEKLGRLISPVALSRISNDIQSDKNYYKYQLVLAFPTEEQDNSNSIISLVAFVASFPKGSLFLFSNSKENLVIYCEKETSIVDGYKEQTLSPLFKQVSKLVEVFEAKPQERAATAYPPGLMAFPAKARAAFFEIKTGKKF